MSNTNELYHGYIYLTTNLVNNKKYIGLHQENIHNPNYLGSGVALTSAIKKYGRENFSNEVLEWCDSLKELCLREIYFIKKFNAVNNRNYYNLTSGGLIPPSRLGTTLSKAQKEKIQGVNHHMYGKEHSIETKNKMSDKATGMRNPMFKGYYHIPFGIFDTLQKAANVSGVSPTTIHKWCHNSDKKICIQSYKKTKFLNSLDESIIGKTYRELGFYFIRN